MLEQMEKWLVYEHYFAGGCDPNCDKKLPGSNLIEGKCVCPEGFEKKQRKCKPISCKSGQIKNDAGMT